MSNRAAAEAAHAWASTATGDVQLVASMAFMAGVEWQKKNPQLTAEDVLVAHQRTGGHSCICGDLPLGSSFARHQVEMLRNAGVLRSWP